MSSSPTGQNRKVCKRKDVDRKIEKSSQFGCALWKDDGTFEHTSIALYFDGEPCFTINFRPADGGKAVLGTCDGILTIESVDLLEALTKESLVNLGEFSIKTEDGKKEARELVKTFLAFDGEQYDVILNNCRDHVEKVVEKAKHRGGNIKTKGFGQAMKSIRNMDYMYMFVLAIFVISVAVFASRYSRQ